MLTCIQLTYIWSVGFHHVVRVGVLGLIMIIAHAVHRVADMRVVLRLCTLLAGDVFVYIYIYMYVCISVCVHTWYTPPLVAVLQVVL